MQKLERLLNAVHRHAKMMLIEERPIHELIVPATQQNWQIIRAHIERMVTIFEAIIREGVEAGEFDVDDAAHAALVLGASGAKPTRFHTASAGTKQLITILPR